MSGEQILHYNTSFIADFPGVEVFRGPGTEVSSIVRKALHSMKPTEKTLTSEILRKTMRKMSDGCSTWIGYKIKPDKVKPEEKKDVIFVGLVEQNLIRKKGDDELIDLIEAKTNNDGLNLGLYERIKIIRGLIETYYNEMTRIYKTSKSRDVSKHGYVFYADYIEFSGTYPSNCLIIKTEPTYEFIHCNTIDLGVKLQEQNYYLKMKFKDSNGNVKMVGIDTINDTDKDGKIIKGTNNIKDALKNYRDTLTPDGGRPMSYVVLKDTKENRCKVYCTFSGINIPHLVYIDGENIQRMIHGNPKDYENLYKQLIRLINDEITPKVPDDMEIDMYLTCDSNDTRKIFIKLITDENTENTGFIFNGKKIKMGYDGELPKACCANIDSVDFKSETYDPSKQTPNELKTSHFFKDFIGKRKSTIGIGKQREVGLLSKTYFPDGNFIDNSHVNKDLFKNVGDYILVGSSDKKIIVKMNTEYDDMTTEIVDGRHVRSGYTNSDHTPVTAEIVTTAGGRRRTRRRRTRRRRSSGKRRMSRRRRGRRSTRRKR